MTGEYKIATFINNMVKKLANIRKLRTELTECIIKLLVNTYNYNKHLLLNGLKLLRDERNVRIFLFLTDKIQRDWLNKKCEVTYKGEDEI